MRKNLLTVGLLALTFSAQAQVLTHVDKDGLMYVGKGALVYNGGGFQMKDNGTVENHGNVMVVGSGADVFNTLTSTNGNKVVGGLGGVFVNKLNEPNNYASVNDNNPAVTPVYTYGQLYIQGLTQGNIQGIVNQEYRQVKHGDYQQIGLPFYDKTFSDLSTAAEFGKTFSTSRWSKNEILWWNNPGAVFENISSVSAKTMQPTASYGYYILGSLGLDSSSKVFTIQGRPYAEENTPSIQLKDGGNVQFGTGGNNVNAYNEKYNTYLQDGFSATTPWNNNYGKNIYQFSNPYLTNLDLSRIGKVETGATVTDGNDLANIQGLRLEVSGVQYSNVVGGGSSSYKFVTFPSGVPSGDVDYMVVRPMGTFTIKLLDNTLQPTFYFDKLRRFNYHPRAEATSYSVSAAKSSSSASTNTVKQLTVIGLNAAGNEVGRTYYLVSPETVTGFSNNATAQAANQSGAVIGTYEEALNGGYDNVAASLYWLYINEANEVDFQGKNIKLVDYTTPTSSGANKITQLRFEVKENGTLLSAGQHALTSGIGFYYKKANGTAMQIAQGDIIPVAPVTGTYTEYDLYYGAPNSAVLATSDVKPNRTLVVYDTNSDNYVVMFDPNWKTANIQVFDMTGKLVINAKSVKTDSHYVIPVDKNVKGGYVVTIVSNTGEKVSTKFLR